MLCPVCDSPAHESNPIRRIVDGQERVFVINHCRACDARFDQRVATVDESRDEERQALAGVEFYRPGFAAGEYQELLKINTAMLGAFARFFRLREIYVEIGVGLGILTRAAGTIFEHSYGLDLEVETARGAAEVPPTVEFLRHQDFIRDVDCAISALCAWHVIEHLPHPRAVLEPLIARMANTAVAFGQIPLFRPDYVYDAHYIFHSEKSLLTLFGSFGLTPILLERDETNDFLTYCFRKCA